MTATDMDHMKHLSRVVQDDILVLEQKEATYKGSWKAAGGRSAWFMARRNMDRLMEMMRKPDDPPGWSQQNLDDTINAIIQNLPRPGDAASTAAFVQHLRDCYVAENIFAKIRENPSGADGTVLACMRDLRRYLILVEAEMMARGVVAPEVAQPSDSGELPRSIPRMPKGMTGPVGPSGNPDLVNPASKELGDESVHASLFPWQRSSLPKCGAEERLLWDKFYRHLAPKMYRLEAFVESSEIPRDIHHCYDLFDVSAFEEPDIQPLFVLCIQSVPADLQDCYPRLTGELNAKEYDESHYRWAYELDKADGKYKLQGRFADWRADVG